MGRVRNCVARVTMFYFLVLSGSGVSPFSSAVMYEKTALHVRKLLKTTASAAKDVAATATVMQDRRITALSECSEEAVVVSQDNQGPMRNGIPIYAVTITNTCIGCTVRNVHVACGEFASTELVSPSDFRRLAVGDCLVRNGAALAPGDTIAFEYSNSFMYNLNVASVSC